MASSAQMNHKRQTRLAALERSSRTRHRSLTRAGGTDFSGPPTAASAMSVKKVPGSVRSFRETTTALSAVVTAGQAMTAKYQLLMASDAQRLAHDCLKQRVQDARSRFGPLARPRCRYAWLRVGCTTFNPDGEAAWALGTRPAFEQLPKKTSPGSTSAREFRVILLCPTVLFGAQMAATPSRPADP